MQEFSNFENFQFVNNTTFSKFSQNLSFYYKDLRPKKKLLQFTQRITKKILAGIGEPMVPTFGGLANIDPVISQSKRLFKYNFKSDEKYKFNRVVPIVIPCAIDGGLSEMTFLIDF
jgi:hypothetical protein